MEKPIEKVESVTSIGGKRKTNCQVKNILIENKSGQIQKSNAELFVQNFTIRLVPNKDSFLARSYWVDHFFFLKFENSDDIGEDYGVWALEENTFLFVNDAAQLYLVQTTDTALCFTEILKPINKIKVIEDSINFNISGTYAVPVQNMQWAGRICAEINEDATNLEVIDIKKKNDLDITVTVKSKLTKNEFTYIVDRDSTQEIAELKNNQIGKKLSPIPPSLIQWKLSDKDIANAELLEKQGFRHWISKDMDALAFAKFIELKNKTITVETHLGKRLTLDSDSLREEDKEYITKNKKPN